jgi:Na+-driven multidrug efflux pump
MGVKGAAIATIIGQIASCILTVIYFFRPRAFKFHKTSFKLSRSVSMKIGQLGISSLIIQLAIVVINAVVGIIAMLLFEFCPQIIVRLFGSESDLYNEFAYLCFRIFLGGIFLCCMQKTGSIFLQAIGKPLQSTLLSLSRDVIFLVPAVIIMAVNFGVTGMLWAAPIADILAFIFTVILIAHEIKLIRHLEVKRI